MQIQGNFGLGFFVFALSLCIITADNHWGLSAVTVNDRTFRSYSTYYQSHENIKNWVTSTNEGLFINGMELDADYSDNSTFIVLKSGVYYVTANIMTAFGRGLSSYYYHNTNSISGKVRFLNSQGYSVSSSMQPIKSYLQPNSSSGQRRNIKMSGYLSLQTGWVVRVEIAHARSYITIKAGSTLSLLYTSELFTFPGIQTRGISQNIELKPPEFLENLQGRQNLRDSGTMLSMAAEGDFVAPLDGLYHVIANINIQRRTDVVFTFAIVVNNSDEAVSMTTSFISEATTTVILETVLNLVKDETISITISSKNKNATLDVNNWYFSICYKGEISTSHPGVSSEFTKSDKRLSANVWNLLSQWNLNAKPWLRFGNNEFHSGVFISSKTGYYFVVFAISISNCSNAMAKFNLKQAKTSTVNSVGPGFQFVDKNEECYVDVSLILHLDINDTLQVSVKSDSLFTIQPTTTIQILYHSDVQFWPAAKLTIKKSLSISTNQALAKVTGWSLSPRIGYNMFFTMSEDNIRIRVPGLYIVSCSIVLKRAPNFLGQFEAQLSVNGKTTGIKCHRHSIPQSFTCVMSDILNLLEKDSVTVLVKTEDQLGSKKESVFVLPSSSMSVVLVGNVRSHPSFRLAVSRHGVSTTKAKTTSLTSFGLEFSNTTNTFSRIGGLYSKFKTSFKTGSQNAFFIQSSTQFQLLSQGQLSTDLGSTEHTAHAYGHDKTKGFTSVAASAIAFNDRYYFNISGKASSSDFKWSLQSGSIASGVYIGNRESLIAFQASSNQRTITDCSSKWRQVEDWTNILNIGNPGTFTYEGFNVSQSGLYFVSLNLVMITKVPGKIVDVRVFVGNDIVLFASETTPKGSNLFNIPLQGFLTLSDQQIIKVLFKCHSSFEMTYSNQTSISSFRVDKDPVIPGLHWHLRPSGYYTHTKTRKFVPSNYNNNRKDTEYYAVHAEYNRSTYTTSVSRSGIYFVSLTGELNDQEQSNFIFSTNPSSTSCVYPFFFKKTHNLMRSVSASGLVFLRKDQNFALIDLPGRLSRSFWASHVHYYYNRYSNVYLSLHYIGNLELSTGFSSTLKSTTSLTKGSNVLDTTWLAGNTCGTFSTPDVLKEFKKYKAVQSSIHMVSVSLTLKYRERCHVSVCVVINGRSHHDDQNCFEHHLMNDTFSNTTTSTVGGSILIHLKEGEQVAIKVNNMCALTISNRSSLSVVDIGNPNTLYGFSSMITTTKATLSAVLVGRNIHHSYYYVEYEDTPTVYDVQGWTTDTRKSKTVFNRGVPLPLNEMFVCSKTGVYLILVKLHVQGKVLRQSDGCVVGAKLAVDSIDTNIGVQQLFLGTTNTLSFTTTARLRKWQALTVRFTNIRKKCGNVEIGQGTTFAAIYMSGTVESFIIPSATPHIVKIPPPQVYIRIDKDIFSKLTCKAVGEYPLKYQWIKNEKVMDNSSTLEVKKLGISNRTVQVSCVVTMGTVVSRSTISVTFFDPTLEFVETYVNKTYYVEERNETQYPKWGYSDTSIATFGIRERMPYRIYYWYWSNSIRCSIVNGNYNNTFYISNNYHYHYRYRYDATLYYTLYVKDQQIDREKITEYNLTISCANEKYDVVNATTTVHVVILDINDNIPEFEQTIYNATIPRNIRPGEDIIQVMATDQDTAQNGDITYKLRYASYSFMIDEYSGVISLSRHEKLDEPLYILTVEATDHGNPPRSSSVNVIIIVHGFKYYQTNNHPVFDKSVYTTYIIKLAPIGSLVKLVHAYNPADASDKRIIVYSIFSGDDETFSINSRTGLITTKGNLLSMKYELSIAAEYLPKPQKRGSDGDEQYMNITMVIIKVEDVDVTKPQFLKSYYETKIPEDIAINTAVLRVKAVDKNLPSKSYLTYSIPTTLRAFVIDSRSGEIRVAAKLDYETTKQYGFVVSVHGLPEISQSSCTDVTINIEDVNDNTPIIVSRPPETIKLAEHTPIGTHIGNIAAIDRDQGQNGKIKYYLEKGSEYFSIDFDTGVILTRKLLGCCDMVFSLKVEIKDEGTPPRSTSIEINVEIVRDYVPVHNRHTKVTGSSTRMTIIIASLCGGFVIMSIFVIVIYCKRRRRRQNFAASTNYITLPTNDEDEELLDHSDDGENERRLSLISATSAGSQEHLLHTEVQC